MPLDSLLHTGTDTFADWSIFPVCGMVFKISEFCELNTYETPAFMLTNWESLGLGFFPYKLG